MALVTFFGGVLEGGVWSIIGITSKENSGKTKSLLDRMKEEILPEFSRDLN